MQEHKIREDTVHSTHPPVYSILRNPPKNKDFWHFISSAFYNEPLVKFRLSGLLISLIKTSLKSTDLELYIVAQNTMIYEAIQSKSRPIYENYDFFHTRLQSSCKYGK